jgi:hypothetical protein
MTMCLCEGTRIKKSTQAREDGVPFVSPKLNKFAELVFWYLRLKGRVSRDFLLLGFFYESAPEYSKRTVSV